MASQGRLLQVSSAGQDFGQVINRQNSTQFPTNTTERPRRRTDSHSNTLPENQETQEIYIISSLPTGNVQRLSNIQCHYNVSGDPVSQSSGYSSQRSISTSQESVPLLSYTCNGSAANNHISSPALLSHKPCSPASEESEDTEENAAPSSRPASSEDTSPKRKRKSSSTDQSDGDDKKKDKKKEMNRRYAKESRDRKTKKMLKLEKETESLRLTTEIYKKAIAVYCSRLHNKGPTWETREFEWYSGQTSTDQGPEKVTCLFPLEDDNFMADIGNTAIGNVVKGRSSRVMNFEISSSSSRTTKNRSQQCQPASRPNRTLKTSASFDNSQDLFLGEDAVEQVSISQPSHFLMGSLSPNLMPSENSISPVSSSIKIVREMSCRGNRGPEYTQTQITDFLATERPTQALTNFNFDAETQMHTVQSSHKNPVVDYIDDLSEVNPSIGNKR